MWEHGLLGVNVVCCDVNESRMAPEDLSLWLVLIDTVLCEGVLKRMCIVQQVRGAGMSTLKGYTSE